MAIAPEKLLLQISLDQTLAEQLTEEEMNQGRLYPPLSNIREVSVRMAIKVSQCCAIIFLE